MPHIDGLHFIQKLVEMKCRRPHIAIVSGSWEESDAALARELGCKVFQKPITLDELVDWIEEVESNLPPNRVLFDWA